MFRWTNGTFIRYHTYQTYVLEKCSLTMYKRVTKTVLDDISIQITSEDSVNIPFDSDVNMVIV